MENTLRTDAIEPGWLQRVVIGRNPRLTLVRIIVLLVVVTVVSKFILLPIRVHGISMLPTYRQSGVNFVNRLAYVSHGPARGDVVAVRYAGKHLMLMKRVVGLPGERIAFVDGTVYINGEPLREPYVKLPCNWTLPEQPIGPQQYFVVGDNRSMGADDHEMGRADLERIVGKVLL